MSYVLRDPRHGYFRGLVDGDDVVWTQEEKRAWRFQDRDAAELVMVGMCPDAEVVKASPGKPAPTKGKT